LITHIELSSSFKGKSSDESLIHDSSDDSTDDERSWVKEMRKNYRLLKKKQREKEREEENMNEEEDFVVKNEIDELHDITENDINFDSDDPEKEEQNM